MEFACKNFKAQPAHVFRGVRRNVETLRMPTVLAGSFEQITRAATDVQQLVCLAVRRELSSDLFESFLDERGSIDLFRLEVVTEIEILTGIPR